ncbi:MAG: hypothetical protein AMXMBFR13_32960 [Phycisphaerae bacterium]
MLARPMVAPPLGAAESRDTVHEPLPPEVSEGGVQVMPPSAVGATRVMELLSEAPPKVAVRIAVALALSELAVTLKVAVVAPAGTVTAVGAESAELLFDTETVAPPLGAASLKVTVQLPLSPELSEFELQVKLVSPLAATRLIELLRELPFKEAVITAVALDVIAAAAAVKFAEAAPAVTETAVGTVSQALLLESATITPPAGAAALRVTVQTLLESEVRDAGLQVRLRGTTGPARFSE